jgi:hypothetical protein
MLHAVTEPVHSLGGFVPAVLYLDGERGHTLVECQGLGKKAWYLHMCMYDTAAEILQQSGSRPVWRDGGQCFMQQHQMFVDASICAV